MLISSYLPVDNNNSQSQFNNESKFLIRILISILKNSVVIYFLVRIRPKSFNNSAVICFSLKNWKKYVPDAEDIFFGHVSVFFGAFD